MTSNTRVDFILKHSKGKKVLHVGCADWPYTERRIAKRELLHIDLNKVSKKLVGIDISDEGIDALKKFDKDLDVYHIDHKEYYNNEKYEIIVATEVIEHVLNQDYFLKFLTGISSEKTLLVITTPNAYSMKGCLRALGGQEYQHPDHVLLHSTNTITHLLNNHGWSIKIIDYYSPPSNSLLSNIANFGIYTLEKIFSHRIKDGIMLVAERKTK